jgi:hypothetical protein
VKPRVQTPVPPKKKKKKPKNTKNFVVAGVWLFMPVISDTWEDCGLRPVRASQTPISINKPGMVVYAFDLSYLGDHR